MIGVILPRREYPQRISLEYHEIHTIRKISYGIECMEEISDDPIYGIAKSSKVDHEILCEI